MTRVVIIVEGQTEEAFVNEVLAGALWPDGVYPTPILLGVPGHKGGRPNYARVRKDVVLHLKQDKAAYCSTMLDFYGLGPGFPGMPVPPGLPSTAKAARVEQAMKADVCELVPDLRPDMRFVPIFNCTNTKDCSSAIPASSLKRSINLILRKPARRCATPFRLRRTSMTTPSPRLPNG